MSYTRVIENMGQITRSYQAAETLTRDFAINQPLRVFARKAQFQDKLVDWGYAMKHTVCHTLHNDR